MTPEEGYREAEKRIAKAQKSGNLDLRLYDLYLTEIPPQIANLQNLKYLDLSNNQIVEIPKTITNFKNLKLLALNDNKIIEIPDEITNLENLEYLYLSNNQIGKIPDGIDYLKNLRELHLNNNQIEEIPDAIINLRKLLGLYLENNPLNPALEAVYKQGPYELEEYLRERAKSQITLNEGKLILVGEGAVGKSCLLGALRGDEWIEGRSKTHGIEIKPCQFTHNQTEITLNGWDFGGQTIYRPTHQLFFTAPAVYLVVWNPRMGIHQGCVEYWITLVIRRAPQAKILVIATHKNPNQSQPDIPRQQLIEKFGEDTIIDFLFVNSKPEEETGIAELKNKIAEVAYHLPAMGEKVPQKWESVWETLENKERAYLSYREVINICQKANLENEQAELFLETSHRLGRLIHYHNDPTLKDIVILKPDWLAKAISFILDDEITKNNQGIITIERLRQIWKNPPQKNDQGQAETGYPDKLHDIFLRLMERFDLCYPIKKESQETNEILIAQLVTEQIAPFPPAWSQPKAEQSEKVQFCRFFEKAWGRPAEPEGLIYRLIVRFYRYSLGQDNYADSVHWQKGLMLKDSHRNYALIEQIEDGIKITVRGLYPDGLLYAITEDIQYLIKEFWMGIRCEIFLPCIHPCGMNKPGLGLFEKETLYEYLEQEITKIKCSVSGCKTWFSINDLLRKSTIQKGESFQAVVDKLDSLNQKIDRQGENQQKILENQDKFQAELDFSVKLLMNTLTDEAKEAPRLFSLIPVDTKFLDSPAWIEKQFQLILWCEHSRCPLPWLNYKSGNPKAGVYQIAIKQGWLKKAAPWIIPISKALSIGLPALNSAFQLGIDDQTYSQFKENLDLGQKSLEAIAKTSDSISQASNEKLYNLEVGELTEARGSILREFQAIIKQKDPGFGGLEKVQTNQGKFLWVHPQFIGEY